jgi:phosphoglycerol transferase MdoB-like AlkP superfamily enzyme
MFACGCFVVSLVGGYRIQKGTARFVLTYLLAFALWLGTALVGLQVIVIILDLITWALHMNVSSRSAIAASWTLIPLGVAWVALVVGGGEYHFRHLGRRRSWLLFGFTVLVEALILCVPLLATWANSPMVWR